MVAEILRVGKKADPLSLESLMLNVVVMSREIGPRAAEFSQKVQSRPDYHEYPSGKRVIKAMCQDWWQAWDARAKVVKDPVLRPAMVHKMTITWFIKKTDTTRSHLLTCAAKVALTSASLRLLYA